jgi:hypothetical protein
MKDPAFRANFNLIQSTFSKLPPAAALQLCVGGF